MHHILYIIKKQRITSISNELRNHITLQNLSKHAKWYLMFIFYFSIYLTSFFSKINHNFANKPK